MAPIYTAATGVIPQIVDDERLLELKSQLEKLELLVPLERRYATPEEVELPLDIDRLISLLEPWQRWTFEEQVSMPLLSCLRPIFSENKELTRKVIPSQFPPCRLTYKNGSSLSTKSMPVYRTTFKSIQIYC